MGGLVSRWFIEREGGNRVVDHLIMFGTPNNGSPFGKVDMARRLTSLLTTLAINTIPAFAPFGAALLSALVRSQKLTPTLEQLNPGSDFIRTLNTSDDPAVAYTIVAGDIRDYREESEKLIPELIAKVGGGVLFDALFQNAGHDIAVRKSGHGTAAYKPFDHLGDQHDSGVRPVRRSLAIRPRPIPETHADAGTDESGIRFHSHSEHQ